MPSSMLRVDRSSSDARHAYNRLSRWYDLLAGGSEGPLRELGLSLLDVKCGERVLEIGYGTGHALVALAQAVGPAGSVVGLDISDGMARVAADRLSSADHRDRVLLCLANGVYHCVAGQTVDAVFLSFTLELFDTPEIPRVLENCYQVLRSEGRICVVSLVKDDDGDGIPVRVYEWAHRRWPQWVDCRPIPLRQILTSAGLHITDAVRRRMWGLPVDVVVASVE